MCQLELQLVYVQVFIRTAPVWLEVVHFALTKLSTSADNLAVAAVCCGLTECVDSLL